MDKVLTARAWGYVKPLSGALAPEATCSIYGVYNAPVLLVHGATESDILAGLSLLAKSREVCEYTSGDFGSVEVYYPLNHDRDHIPTFELPHFCPIEGCGRRVVVKEGSGK